MRLFRITRGQHSAFISIIAAYMRMSGEPQHFTDCSQDPPEETTTPELLDLLLNYGITKHSEAPESKKGAGVTSISSFRQLIALTEDVFGLDTPAQRLAMQLIDTARECGRVEALKDLQDRKLLESMKPVTETRQ